MNPTHLTLVHAVLALTLPIALVGVVNRTKSWWAGRKGPRLLQSAHDLRRLRGKRPVVSTVASPLFRVGPYVVLVCSLLAMSVAPLLGSFAPLQFSHDFVALAYTLGLARIALMVSAMDVGGQLRKPTLANNQRSGFMAVVRFRNRGGAIDPHRQVSMAPRGQSPGPPGGRQGRAGQRLLDAMKCACQSGEVRFEGEVLQEMFAERGRRRLSQQRDEGAGDHGRIPWLNQARIIRREQFRDRAPAADQDWQAESHCLQHDQPTALCVVISREAKTIAVGKSPPLDLPGGEAEVVHAGLAVGGLQVGSARPLVVFGVLRRVHEFAGHGQMNADRRV